MERFDAAIIGGGPGGYVAALRLAARGARAALIEQRQLGGVCLNTGCIPTKALLAASGLFADLRRAERWGIRVGQVGLDFARLVQHKDQVVGRLRKGLAGLLARRKVHCITGRGRLIDAHTVLAETADGPIRIHAENVILATGTEPAIPAGLTVDHQRVLTTDDALALTDQPDVLLVVGGGTNGVEFATIFAELGTKVTVVEMLERLMPTADEDASNEVARSLKRQGVTVLCGTSVQSIESGGAQVSSTLSDGRTVETSCVLIAAGRRVCLNGIGLEDVGIERDGPFVRIDQRCRTSVPGIYAVGDITGKDQYAHLAYRQGTVAADAIAGHEPSEDYRAVPRVAFTHPQVAEVGVTEAAARAAGYDVAVAKFPMTASGAAQAADQPAGFCKLIAEAPARASSPRPDSQRVLGAVIVAPHAAELVHELAAAVKHGLSVQQIAQTIHAHPTLAESVGECADMLLGLPLHMA